MFQADDDYGQPSVQGEYDGAPGKTAQAQKRNRIVKTFLKAALVTGLATAAYHFQDNAKNVMSQTKTKIAQTTKTVLHDAHRTILKFGR